MGHTVILFAGRFPSEKAAALFVDLNARSLVEAGTDVTVVAPRRLGRGRAAATAYGVTYLPVIDLSRIPVLWSIANFITVWTFAKRVYMWLLFRTDRDVTVLSNDAWPLLVATLVRRNTIFEMHDFAKDSWMYRTLFKRVRFVLVTNEWKRTELMRRFGVPAEKIMLERNAVDMQTFGHRAKEEARAALKLDRDAKLVVYTGHLYEWKGADTLAAAARMLPDVQFVFVGGAPADVETFSTAWGNTGNIRIVGHVVHNQIPLWQSAADVLALPNSGKQEISVHYTSPMKLFEYMASGRAIVASDLPSIREVLPDDAGYFAVPDDAASFAAKIREALSDGGAQRADRARKAVSAFTWEKRAERILNAIV